MMLPYSQALRRFARFFRMPPGITARREFERQGRDFLQVAQQLTDGPPPIVAIVCRTAEGLEGRLEAISRHAIVPCELVLLASRNSGAKLRIPLEKFAGVANARVVWTDGRPETLRDVLRA